MAKPHKAGISSCRKSVPAEFKFKLSRAAIEADLKKIRALEAELSESQTSAPTKFTSEDDEAFEHFCTLLSSSWSKQQAERLTIGEKNPRTTFQSKQLRGFLALDLFYVARSL